MQPIKLLTLNDLEKLTTYALWVRAECTSGYSDWEKFLFITQSSITT